MVHSGIEGWWQGTQWPTSPRPRSLITMSVTLMAASCDSIGSCSLDVDAESLADSLADSTRHEPSVSRHNAGGVDANAASLSERTLHSLLLTASTSSKGLTPDGPAITEDQLTSSPTTVKKPSYLNLACSISGYGGITTYDSKLREGFRSRDHSPGRLVGIQNGNCEGSPARGPPGCRSSCGNFLSAPNSGLSSSGRNCWTPSPVSGQAIGKVDMKHISPTIGASSQINGSNGTDQTDAASNFSIKRFTDQRNRWLESTLTTSPGKVRNYENSKLCYETSSENKQCYLKETSIETSYESSVRSQSRVLSANNPISSTSSSSYSAHSQNERIIPVLLESANTTKNHHRLSESAQWLSNGATLQHTPVSSKSFIQQRVERLYGPGALAQGFFQRSCRSPVSVPPAVCTGSTASLPPKSNTEQNETPHYISSRPELPVLRHLRPEFREQLPVAPRRSLGTRSTSETPPSKNRELSEVQSAGFMQPLQNQTSTESLADLQPAAPEVVLPSPPKSDATLTEPSVNGSKIESLVPADPPKVEDLVGQKMSDVTTPKEAGTFESAVDPNENAGHRFLRIRQQTIERVLVLAENAELQITCSGKDGNPVLSEEALGHLRAAAGQARLLVNQKMVQFEGLCRKCINQHPDEQFPTTAQDLQGFWEMLLLQVDQVHNTFQRLEKLKAVDWCEENLPAEDRRDTTDSGASKMPASHKKVLRSAKPAQVQAKTSEAAAARKQREDERRKMMEERRRQLKQQQKNQKTVSAEESVEIFTPQSC